MEPTIAPTVSEIVSAKVTPPIVNASVSSVPSTSTSPDMSSVAMTAVPVIVGAVSDLFVRVCVAALEVISKPPAVLPSCTLIVSKVVSTLTSPRAPVKALFWVVVPRLS